jgi:hypothetical protein
MTANKPTKCPTCGERPELLTRVRETTGAGFGEVLPEPAIVERATCKNGHKWFARDEKL